MAQYRDLKNTGLKKIKAYFLYRLKKISPGLVRWLR